MPPKTTEPPADTPRRLTPSERQHEALMQALARTPRGPEYDGKLTLNAKGDVQIEWSAKGDDYDLTIAALRNGFDALVAAYPRAADTNGGEK